MFPQDNKTAVKWYRLTFCQTGECQSAVLVWVTFYQKGLGVTHRTYEDCGEVLYTLAAKTRARTMRRMNLGEYLPNEGIGVFHRTIRKRFIGTNVPPTRGFVRFLGTI